MKIKVGISNRHIHLTKETKDILFGKEYELTKRNDLTQEDDFACNETITLKTDKGILENIRVIGPFRNYNQVEISRTDSYKLGLNPPVRDSGDITGSEKGIIIGPKGEYKLEDGIIIASRHLHVPAKDLERLGFKEGNLLKARINSEKPGTIERISFKSKEDYTLELHLDTDDGNAFMLKTGDEIEIMEE